MWTEDQYEKFVDEMTAKYPKMYSDQYGGFAVGPGWWPIIQSLSHHIQTHIDWNNLNAKQRPDLKYKPIEQVVVRQVKEKFGGLRFYYDGGNDIIAGMVTIAEAWANSTCEDCGSPGKKRSGGWIKTLCDHHHEQSEKQRRKDF